MNETEQLAALKAFARDIFAGLGYDLIDEEDVQTFAQKHGLISLETITRPCGSNCICAEIYEDGLFEAGGVKCNVIAPWVFEDVKEKQSE